LVGKKGDLVKPRPWAGEKEREKRVCPGGACKGEPRLEGGQFRRGREKRGL